MTVNIPLSTAQTAYKVAYVAEDRAVAEGDDRTATDAAVAASGLLEAIQEQHGAAVVSATLHKARGE